MKYIDILASFETEINLINDTVNKPATDDSLFWLNQAVAKFVKQRFNGDLVQHTSYEQTEKRREDLIHLFKSKTYTGSDMLYQNMQPSYDEYYVEYPNDFLFALNEDVIISDNNSEHLMDTCVFECTQDSFMYRVNNSLTDFHYRFRRARPLRIRDSKGCKLLTDKIRSSILRIISNSLSRCLLIIFLFKSCLYDDVLIICKKITSLFIL